MAKISEGTNQKKVSYSRILVVSILDTENDHTIAANITGNNRITDDILDDIVCHVIERTSKVTLDDTAEDTIRYIAEGCALIEERTDYELSIEILDEPMYARLFAEDGEVNKRIKSLKSSLGYMSQYTIWHDKETSIREKNLMKSEELTKKKNSKETE